MVTYQQLIAADTSTTREAAAAWRTVAARTTSTADNLYSLLATLVWSGPAAESAVLRLSTVGGALDAASPLLASIDQSLSDHADGLAAAQQAVLTATNDSGYGRVTVRPDGSVSLDRTGERPDAGDAVMAARMADEIRGALARADRCDARTAGRLREAGPDRRIWPGSPGPTAAVPPRGTPPDDVARWWRSLTDGQHDRLIADAPEIGHLDGVPVDIRDQVNRVSLSCEHRGLLNAAAHGAGPAIRRRLAAVEALLARLNATASTRAWLVDIDPVGDGRAVVALGDPDRSTNVLTFVPGAGASLDSIGGSLGRAQHLADAARAHDPSTSVVLWLGYDAPDNPAVAAWPGYARQAETDLHRFQEGLRVTHDGNRSHNVVLGHSYGSVVLGYTARDLGLDLDDAIVVGSPGIGVDDVRDLREPAGHVWASVARHDAIKAAVHPAGLLPAPQLDPLLRPLSGAPSDDLWYGPNPADPAFGARVFTSDPGRATDPIGTHDSYFDPDNQALDTIAKITVGDYGGIR